MKVKTIQGKEFLKQLSELSGYRLYEVEDILNNLAIAIADNTKQGYNTCIRGIGTFKAKSGYNICGISNLTGEEYNTMTKNSLSFKADSIMLNMLNNIGD